MGFGMGSGIGSEIAFKTAKNICLQKGHVAKNKKKQALARNTAGWSAHFVKKTKTSNG